jgi:FkbH-like protein
LFKRGREGLDRNQLRQYLNLKDERLLPEFFNDCEMARSLSDYQFLYQLKHQIINNVLFKDLSDSSTRDILILSPANLHVFGILMDIQISAISRSFCYNLNYRFYGDLIGALEEQFKHKHPDFLMVFPTPKVNEQSISEISHLFDFFKKQENKFNGEIAIANLPLPPTPFPGANRNKYFSSAWRIAKDCNQVFIKDNNFSFHLIDLEFLSALYGTENVFDTKQWYQSKSPFTYEFSNRVAKECVALVRSKEVTPKKVIALDLDGTLWKGECGDLDVNELEVGPGYPTGEIFAEAQKFFHSLKERGFLLTLLSKNDESRALKTIVDHPGMVLKIDDFSCHQINWDRKSQNIVSLSRQLNLGLESFIFVDDNPAEIAEMGLYHPEVHCVQVPSDLSKYLSELEADANFHTQDLTDEDLLRTKFYKDQERRNEDLKAIDNEVLRMQFLQTRAEIGRLNAIDKKRALQLINKTNQFNLTRCRLLASEFEKIASDETKQVLTCKVWDRYGFLGLISTLIASKDMATNSLWIDAWVMSCRLLGRNIPEAILNQVVLSARLEKLEFIFGRYLKSDRNGPFADLYTRLGFELLKDNGDEKVFRLDVSNYVEKQTQIEEIR